MEDWNAHVVHVMEEVTEKLTSSSRDVRKDPAFKEMLEHLRARWRNEENARLINFTPFRTFRTFLTEESAEQRYLDELEAQDLREWLVLNEEVKGSFREKL